MHEYGHSAQRGKAGVAAMLRHLVALGYTLEREAAPNSMDQWDGIDLFVREPTGALLAIEVKQDERGLQTGRAFIETVSNDTTGRPGWCYTCKADVILYFLPGEGDGVVYWIHPLILRDRVSEWLARADRREGRFQHLSALNAGYRTRGVAVPFHELGAVRVTDVPR